MIVIGSETTLPPGTRSGKEDRVSPGIAWYRRICPDRKYFESKIIMGNFNNCRKKRKILKIKQQNW